jgi:hypothetical protein
MDDVSEQRSFRVRRSISGRWTVERFAGGPEGEDWRELSGTFPTREQAEKALLRYMREESRRCRRDWHRRG